MQKHRKHEESITNMTDLFYTVEEVANRFSVSKATIIRDVHAGRIPCLKLGTKTWRIPKAYVDQRLLAMERHEVEFSDLTPAEQGKRIAELLSSYERIRTRNIARGEN